MEVSPGGLSSVFPRLSREGLPRRPHGLPKRPHSFPRRPQRLPRPPQGLPKISRKSVVLQVLIIVIMHQCSKLLMLEPTWRPFMVLSAITKNISRTAITNHISSTTILLLATFGIVPIWCFCRVVSPGPFFQNDLFKRSFASFRAGSSLLKFHLISCIARRHSSKYMVKYIQ